MVVATEEEFEDQASNSSMHTAITFFKEILATQDNHIIFITKRELQETVDDWKYKGHVRTELEEKFGSIAK